MNISRNIQRFQRSEIFIGIVPENIQKWFLKIYRDLNKQYICIDNLPLIFSYYSTLV